MTLQYQQLDRAAANLSHFAVVFSMDLEFCLFLPLFRLRDKYMAGAVLLRPRPHLQLPTPDIFSLAHLHLARFMIRQPFRRFLSFVFVTISAWKGFEELFCFQISPLLPNLAAPSSMSIATPFRNFSSSLNRELPQNKLPILVPPSALKESAEQNSYRQQATSYESFQTRSSFQS